MHPQPSTRPLAAPAAAAWPRDPMPAYCRVCGQPSDCCMCSVEPMAGSPPAYTGSRRRLIACETVRTLHSFGQRRAPR